MAVQWNSKYAIMQDLSLAQGSNVPVDVDDTIAAGEKPPTLELLEETEEEFFSSYTGGIHDDEGPDLSAIQLMLSLVKEADAETEDTSLIMQDSLLSQQKTEITEYVTEKPKKMKRGKNVALESIIQSNTLAIPEIQNTSETDISKPLTLLKPNYFIGEDVTNKNYNQSDNNGAIKKDKEKKNKPVLELQPNSMFKRKLSPLKPKEASCPVKNPSPIMKVDMAANSKNTLQEISDNSRKAQEAKEQFQTYLNSLNIKKGFVNDVWSRAEREMKAIEEMRYRQWTESELEESFPDMSMEEAQRLKVVLLPRHRHYLPEDCIVCEVEYNNQMKQKQQTEQNNYSIECIENIDISTESTVVSLEHEGSIGKSQVEQKQTQNEQDNAKESTENLVFFSESSAISLGVKVGIGRDTIEVIDTSPNSNDKNK